jgi:predicted DNA-binding protein
VTNQSTEEFNMSSRSITVTVSLPLSEVERIEQLARQQGVSRAHFCRELILQAMASINKQEKPAA